MSFTMDNAFGIVRETISTLYAGMPAQILLLILGLLLCFTGCKLIKWASALYGVIAGLMIGICATNALLYFDVVPQDKGMLLNIAAMLVCGIVLGLLSFRFPRLGIFLVYGAIGGMIGYIPATFVAEISNKGFWGMLIVFGLVFAVTGAVFMRAAYLIVTSAAGVIAGFALAGLLDIGFGFQALGMGCGLTVVGFLVQLFLLHRMDAKTDTADAMEEEHAEEEQAMEEECPVEDAALENTSAVQMPIAAETSEAESGEMAEPDDIDTISDTVAARIGMTGVLHTERFQISDEPETAEDSTMVIPKAELSQTPQEEPAEEASEEPEMERFVSTVEQKQMEELLGNFEKQPEEELKTERLDTASDSWTMTAKMVAPEEEEQTDFLPEQEPEAVGEPEKKKKKKHSGGVILPIILIVASLVFAAVGFQYVELMLLLCFLGYVRKHYRSLAFACAILCARREADMIPLILQKENPLQIVPGVISGVIFLILTFFALWKSSRARRQAAEEE
ncbi:MAG: DUF4203 domain-containing protein [Eubacteriales bacterium]|nr:DUF4203 domain-containing protein [Eubacteriales bacterium]